MSKINTEVDENRERNLNIEGFGIVKKYQHTLIIFIPTALLAYLTYLFSTGDTPTLGDSVALILSTMIIFGTTSFFLKDYYWKLFMKNDKIARQYSGQVKEWSSFYETEEMNVICNKLNQEDQDKLESYSISLDNAKNALSLMRFSTNTTIPLAFLMILQFYNLLLIVQ
ncbi:MAG: hypothetical protein ACI9TV_001050 [Sulfurimonas sp.]|jgi:hypothetical protein|uniref:hypothetical protein n=1 Tax=Sulfurimonas sp. TaxID=2022749 RepID=UPI0039E4BE71